MARSDKPKQSGGGLFWKVVKAALVIGIVIPVSLTLLFRFVSPPVTILMVQRAAEGKGLHYSWRPLSAMSPNLVNAAIAAEDARFCIHRGFDFEAIEKAMRSNARGRRLRGGSTISQQTAKNVFLWPGQSRVERWVRKGFETYFTVLIETLWGKRRIMEVYLNVAEMGPGVYGAEAAAQGYFGKPASELTRTEAARIISILPNPLRYKAVNSGPYVRSRTRAIGGNAATVRNEGLAGCVFRSKDG